MKWIAHAHFPDGITQQADFTHQKIMALPSQKIGRKKNQYRPA
jgi:hypothetical protein